MRGWSGPRLLAAAFAAAVAAAIIAGVVVVAPPAEQRKVRLDKHRVQDLSAIAQRISIFARDHGRLPPKLDDLETKPGFSLPVDPVTGIAYEYEPLDGRRYRLCASFDAESPVNTDRAYTYVEGWTHEPGRQCFERKADQSPLPMLLSD